MRLQDLIDAEHSEIILKQKGSARMMLAYHSYGNGVCFGGIRLVPMNAKNAIKDALRLSEAMTYKLAMIDAPYGGCKAVVFEPLHGKSNEFLHDVGTLIEEETGRFISGIDFGFEPDDAKVIRETTSYIFALKDSEFGQSGITTAFGVLQGIKLSLKQVYGSPTISGRSFAIQGLGSVGYTLAQTLMKMGGVVYVSDLDESRLDVFRNQARVVNPSEILCMDVDVVSPCGPAYIINKDTIQGLNCKIIAGGANCQLEDEVVDDKQLHDRGILIAPDYIINAGGVIQGIEELNNGNLEQVFQKLPIIIHNLSQVYSISRKESKPPYQVSKEIALSKINNL